MWLYAGVKRPLKPHHEHGDGWEENSKDTESFATPKRTRPNIGHVNPIHDVHGWHEAEKPKPFIGFAEGQLMLYERAIKGND